MKNSAKKKEVKTETAIFGAGCFWHVELDFSKVPGVLSTEVGYMGGLPDFKNPTYEQVCTNITGYVEVIKIIFDPSIVSYKQLLKVFWKIHNPTQINRQGPDIGTQYRSVIFCQNEKQKKGAHETFKEHQKTLSKKIMTSIMPAKTFFKAEEYHQKYLEKKGLNSCNV